MTDGVSGKSFIRRLSVWPADAEFTANPASPELTFIDPLLRRRLSSISKMTIQVIHGLLPVEEDTKIIFLSFRGELSKQYKINMMQIGEKTITPAAFSFSVFNTPPAMATMALDLKGGYSAIYPDENCFTAGLKAAHAALVSGTQEELIFVYADEEVPAEYKALLSECPPAFAFALLLSRKNGPVPFLSGDTTTSPLDFLNMLLQNGKIHAAS